MDIKQLIGETTYYDKKLALETKRPKSWCKSISAFANCFGGKLVFGVADDDELVGLANAEEDAEKMIDRLQSTMLMKAKAMCDANGVEFDLTVFNTMFNNAKSSAVAGSIETKKALFLSITTINPQNLIKTFTTNFKDSYTVWVNAEAADAKNKK